MTTLQRKILLTTLITLLLPHLDTLDHHLAIILPRGLPCLPAVPEVLLSSGRLVNPWFAGKPILEPTVRTTDGNVEDKVELLVKRRSKVAGLAPRVDQSSSITIRKRKIPAAQSGWLKLVYRTWRRRVSI
jgi:hypothetical protein